VYNFLKEFKYKFDESISDKLERLKELLVVVKELQTQSFTHFNLDEEIRNNYWFNGEIPPSLILILRNLRQLLDINEKELKIREKNISIKIGKLETGQSLNKAKKDITVQTDPIKGLDFKIQVIFLFYLDCKKNYIESSISKT